MQLIPKFSTNLVPLDVLLLHSRFHCDIDFMARYSGLLGHWIEVIYRAGDILLPAKGNLAADSGNSVFLEEHYQHQGDVKIFRWEIPYPCIVELKECPEGPRPPASLNAPGETSTASEPGRGTPQLKSRPALPFV